MSEQRFIGYIQEPDVHDGVIVKATYKSGFLRSVFDKRVVTVIVLTYEERLFVIWFSRVRSASIINADGMRLYSLSEMHATPPCRRFVFVDSEEKSNRYCEVVAREIASIEMTEDFVPKEAIVHLRNLYPKQH
ncbi:MAG TPA: hypothetical protein VFT48_19370 [Pyrinomonadaceae bacterium]|nr:hypothetical protein [Pyrinomonadaceae bacterium]